MNVTRIALRNFKSYVGEHIIDFPSTGLVFLKGDNRVSPELGGNGAGKSTIIDALYWCFYGKTPRGSRGKELLPRGTDETDIIISAVVNEHTVTRTWSTRSINKLLVDGSEVEQGVLVKGILRDLTSVAFMHTVAHGQYEPSFFRMTGGARAALLSEVFELDKWIDYSKRATKRHSSAASRLHGIDLAMSKVEGRLQVLEQTELKEQKTVWDKEHELTRNWIDSEYEEGRTHLKEARKELRRLSTHLKQVESAVSSSAKALSRKERQKDESESNFIQHQEPVARATYELGAAQKDLERARRLKTEGWCQACGQEIDTSYQDTIEGLEKQVENKEHKLERVREGYSNVVKAYQADKGSVKRLTRRLARTKEERAEVLSKVTSVEKTIARLNNSQKGLNDKMRRLNEEKNPFDQRIAENENKVKREREALRTLTRRKEVEGEVLAGLKMWISGFKEVRGLILDELLLTYEAEVSNVLNSLGMTDWAVKVSAGHTERGITAAVVIDVVRNGEKMSANLLSGGESTRVELAMEIALSNLIQSKIGRMNLELWDEPTSYLGEIDLVVQALHSRAADRCVIYIDHRQASSFGYDEVWQVVKTKDGSAVNIEKG